MVASETVYGVTGSLIDTSTLQSLQTMIIRVRSLQIKWYLGTYMYNTSLVQYVKGTTMFGTVSNSSKTVFPMDGKLQSSSGCVFNVWLMVILGNHVREVTSADKMGA